MPPKDDGIEYLRKIGHDHAWIETLLEFDNFNNFHIEFCEELCKTWTFTHRRWHAMRENNYDELTKIKEQEAPVLERLYIQLKIMKWQREKFQYDLISVKNCVELQEEMKKKCKEDILFWFTYFALTFDTRMGELDLHPQIPFCLFPQQKKLVLDIQSWYKARVGGLIEKTREEGISWLAMGWTVWNWLYGLGFNAIISSQKEEKVDVLGSKDTLFGKVRYIIYGLPVWMRPKGMETNDNKFDNQRFIKNPVNGNEIRGEIGDNIGRSGRASVLIIDESQDIEHPDKVDDSAESTTNCRIDIGTPNGMNHFWKRRSSGVLVGTIAWWQDPRKNPEWRKGVYNPESPWWKFTQERVGDPVILARNHMIDYNASVKGAFIQAEWIRAAVEFTDKFDENDEIVAGFDVAGGGENEAVYVCRRGIIASEPKVSPFKTSTDAGWFAIQRGEEDNVGQLNYDADGIGESLYGLYRDSEKPIRFKTVGIRNGKAASDRLIPEEGITCRQKFLNRKAEVWWQLRERLRKTFEHKSGIKFYPLGQLISLPNDDKLLKQLGSPLEVLKSGRIGVESKESMRSRGVPSPDRADALAFAFWDCDEDLVASSFDYTVQGGTITTEAINHAKAIGSQYVSIYQGKDLDVSAICCIWNNSFRSPNLIVYGEYQAQTMEPEEIVEDIEYIAKPDMLQIKEWICNDEMMKGVEEGKSQWYAYKKAGAMLRQNYFKDDRLAMVMINSMFEKKIITIHESCSSLMAQLSHWNHDKSGDANEKFGLATALLQIITRLRTKKELTPETIERAAYGGFNKRKLPEVTGVGV